MRYERKLGASQVDLLLDLHERRIYSVHRELRLFLYAGILLIIAGAGLTVKQYFIHLGDIVVITVLTVCTLAALIYCFWKGAPFARQEVASPNIAFDFVLFFGCAFFSMDVAYIETQFHVLGMWWKNYLLASVTLFLFLAYRFDNRLVLSMALSTLAAWFGFTLSSHRMFSFDEYYRFYAIAYALIALSAGILSYRLALKKHFLGIYLNFASHFFCIALISGIVDYKLYSLYFPILILGCAVLVFYAVKVRKFLYMLYAVIYGYVGISVVIVDLIHRQTFFIFAYFIVTSLIVIGLIFKMSRDFKEVK
jgi:hypothetical protein